MYFLLHPISSLNHFVARIFTDQITLLISIICFILLSLNYKKPFWKSLDKSVFQWAEDSKENYLKASAHENAIFGNAIFHIVFSLILSFIVYFAKHRFNFVLSIFFVLVFSWAFNRVMKLIYKRERPNTPVSSRRRMSYCFPSGHVMASIPIYFFSAVLLQNIMPFLPWYLIAFFISFLVVMTRIYLSHHYFTDVLGGIFMGIFCLHVSIWVYFFIGLL